MSPIQEFSFAIILNFNDLLLYCHLLKFYVIFCGPATVSSFKSLTRYHKHNLTVTSTDYIGLLVGLLQSLIFCLVLDTLPYFLTQFYNSMSSGIMSYLPSYPASTQQRFGLFVQDVFPKYLLMSTYYLSTLVRPIKIKKQD